MPKKQKVTKRDLKTHLAEQAALANWHANGRDPKEAARLGILADMYTDELTPERRKEYAEQAKSFMGQHIEVLQASVVKLWDADKLSAKTLGVALLEVRNTMENSKRGSFTAWYKSKNMDKNRVFYCLSLAMGRKKKTKADAKPSERTNFLRNVHSAYSELFDAVMKGDEETAKQVFTRAKSQLDTLMMMLKARAKGAAA